MEISDEQQSLDNISSNNDNNEELSTTSSSSISVSLKEEDTVTTTSPSKSSPTLKPTDSGSDNKPTPGGADQPVQSSISYHHNAKLIQVTGSEEPFHYISIPLSVDRLNLEDAFIMQSDAYMFVWCSDKVSSQKKAKAIQMAQKLKVEVGCQRPVQVLEFGEEHPTFLFCLGLPKGNKLNITKEENDIFQKDEEDQLLLPEFFLYKLSTGEDGKPSIKPIDEETISQEMLESNACFILDCEHEMYIWQGKDVKKSTKETLIPLAKKIWLQYDRPEYYNKTTPPIITLVFDGAESCLFKSKFGKWVDKAPLMTSYLSLQKKKEALSFEVSSMHQDKEVQEINIGSNDSKGKLLVWSCMGSNGKWIKVDEDDFGIFYSNKSYVCHFIYKPEGKSSIRSVIFYWEGLYANARNYISYKFGLYKEIQKKMQSLQSDDPIEYRIAQNKEPKEFINLFGTELLVLNEELSMKPMIFQVRGNRGTQLYPNPDNQNAKLLNSLDSFVFLFPEKYIIVWHGSASSDEQRLLASDLFTFLPPEYEAGVKEFDEGKESEGFWKLIGGSSNDITRNASIEGGKPKKLKFFLCTENSGIFKADQIIPFSQVDLNNEESVILDTFENIFIWRGSKCTDDKYKQTQKLAKEYLETVNDNRPDTCAIQEESSQNESQLFKSYFHSWKVTVPKVFIDPLIIYKEKQQQKLKEEKERLEKEKLEQEQQVKVEEEPTKVEVTVEEPVKVEEEPNKVEEEPNKVKEEEEDDQIVPQVATAEEETTKVEEQQPNTIEHEKEEDQNMASTEESVKVENESTKANEEEEEQEEAVKVESQPEEGIDEANSSNATTTTTTTTTTTSESLDLQSLSSSQDVVPTPIKEKRKSNEPTAPSSISSSGDMFFHYEPFNTHNHHHNNVSNQTGSPKLGRKGGNKKKHNKKNLSVGSMSPLSSPTTNFSKSLKNDVINQSFDLDSSANTTSTTNTTTNDGNDTSLSLPSSTTSSPILNHVVDSNSSSSSSIASPSSLSSGSSTPKKQQNHHNNHNHRKNKKKHNRSNSNF